MSAAGGESRRSLVPDPTRVGSVKLIGLGGVGGIVARYLAVFLTALGAPMRLVLIDGDDFEAKNASRMLFGRAGNKAAVVSEELLAHLPEASLTLLAIEEYVTGENLPRLIRDGDLVILAVDNHATRKLVAEFCATKLDRVCLVSGGNDGVGEDSLGRVLRGTAGNVQIHVREDGENLTPPLIEFHPEIEDPADLLPTDAHCTDMLESVPQILPTNLAAASAILNAVWLFACDALPYAEVAFDIERGRMAPVPLPLSARA